MQPIYDPAKSGTRMTMACFVSGSGTNYREIAARNPAAHYVVFTNRPGCGGTAVARANKHEVIELSHLPYLKDARKKYGSGKVPRNCPERVAYEQEVCRLVESRIGGEPDLICLAGYDQWLTDWMIDRHYPRILNVHPGDTTKGYDGLHWVPSAKAILAGDEAIRSTVFVVDQGEDTGPVLVQAAPLSITGTLAESEELLEGLRSVTSFAAAHGIRTYEDFEKRASEELFKMMERICAYLQDALKVSGDWKIYPFAVQLIAQGQVQLDGRKVYIDGKEMPAYGYRLDEHEGFLIADC